jgi:hypothetical protein
MDNQKADDAIRVALKNADAKGKLCVVAAVVGSTEKQLRTIMNGTEPLDLHTRYQLIAHLT